MLVGINSVVGNYGIAIFLFTMLIRMVCMPFDYKSRKGMRKMSIIQPKLNELQKKYANDQKKLQQKQSELMRKEGYNPLSGCLPLLLTWPLMIAMFSAMRSIANEQLAMQAFRYLAGETEIVAASERFLWVKNIWMTDSFFTPVAPTAAALNQLTADVWQKAYALAQSTMSESQLQAIAQSIAAVSDTALDFGADAYKTSIASVIQALGNMPAYVTAVQAVKGWEGMSFILFSVTLYQQFNGILLFPILAGVTQVLQYKFNPAMKEQSQPTTGQGSGMGNFMKYFFPILSVFWCLTSNAAFAIYWVSSTVIMWAQSVVITKILEKQDEKKAQAVTGEGSVK